MNPAGQPASEQRRRRSPRSKVLLAAALECDGGGTIPVVLRNLSEHGALIEGAGAIAAGTKVLLRRNSLSAEGHIAWARGGFAGIAFASELKADVVLEQIAPPAAKAPLPPLVHRRPGVTRPGMSAEEQRWLREMTEGAQPKGRRP